MAIPKTSLCGHRGVCGCRHAFCCFECPFEDCLYDPREDADNKATIVATRNRLTKPSFERKKRKALALRAQGIPVARIAEIVGVGKRNVYRYFSNN